MSDADPLPLETPPSRPTRRWLWPVVAVALAGVAVTAFFLIRGSREPSRALVLSLPKGPAWVFGIDPKPVFEFAPVKKGLARTEVQAQLTSLKAAYGVDVLGATGLAGSFQVANGNIELLVVAQLPLDVDKVTSALAWVKGAVAVDMKGKALRKVPLGETLDHYLPSALMKADPPPLLPKVPDILFGPLDDRRFVIGTPTLVEAYLSGGETVASDAELAKWLDAAPSGALAWGAARVSTDSPEAELFRTLSQLVPRPEGAPLPPRYPDVIGSFELHFDGNTLVGVGTYEFKSEADAVSAKKLMEEGFATAKKQLDGMRLGGMKLDVSMTQSGNQASVTLTFPLPVPP